jgi:biotin transport system substrate-specific component
MSSKRLRTIVFVAIFSAMLCVVSQIAIPMPSAVPITLQILMVALAGYVLGILKSFLSIFLYVAIGAIGLPVFSSFNGGISALVGHTGGFIWGFFIVALMCAIFADTRLAIPAGIISVIICHFIGSIQYMLVSRVTLWASILSVSLPYIFKDIILVIVAFFVAIKIKKILNKEVSK